MKHKHQILSASVILLVLFLCAAAYTLSRNRQRSDSEPIELTDFKLNTVISIKIYDSRDTSLLEGCMDLCDQYERIFSRTLETSELYRLNHGLLEDASGVSHISPELADLVEAGLAYSQLSQGKFDISIGPVSSLWDFQTEEPELPSRDQLQNALSLVDYRQVSLEGTELTFARDGMQLDLGAVAKGYIADRIKEYLTDQGIRSAVINLGGNVLCIGSKPDGSPFQVGIQKPFADRNETISSINVSGTSVVSSGIYERCFQLDGTLYHHLLDPSSGYPYDNGLISVTILSDASLDGDGLSTVCFSLGLEEGMKLVERLDNTEALFITSDEQLHYSSGFPKADGFTKTLSGGFAYEILDFRLQQGDAPFSSPLRSEPAHSPVAKQSEKSFLSLSGRRLSVCPGRAGRPGSSVLIPAAGRHLGAPGSSGTGRRRALSYYHRFLPFTAGRFLLGKRTFFCHPAAA